MQTKEIINELKSLAKPEAKEGMARFGIAADKALGVSMPDLRMMGKKIGKDHVLAQSLWDTGIHEARILASLVDDPEQVTEIQMEAWVKEFNSWDLCDQVCGNLFDKTRYAKRKAVEWTERKEEFVKRAGFAVMAWAAFHNKDWEDAGFEKFFAYIIKQSTDERNFVKKAVNWSLRQIGKRNESLNKRAIEAAKKISEIDSKAAKWIAKDAIRELSLKFKGSVNNSV